MVSNVARWATRVGAGAAVAFSTLSVTVTGIARAEVVTVSNRFASGYSHLPFGNRCPNGLTINGMPEGYRIERPHKVFNDQTGQWIIWAHQEITGQGYTTAQALVAQSSTECGPFTFVKAFRPLGYQIRDDYLFKDANGTAYFLAASNKNGGANDTMAIFRLTSDYLDVDTSAGVTWAFDGKFREAPVVMKKGSVYFLLTSQAAGWFPSQGAYATSTSMFGPWSELKNLGNPSTFGGQNSSAIKFAGTSSTANILVMDHLGGNELHNDGLLYLPVLLDDQARIATLDWYSTYYVDTTTGTMTLPSTDSIAANRSATASATGSGSSPQLANDRNYDTRWMAVSSASWPAWWRVDLGSTRHISEIQISWPMAKGSEAYYQYKFEFSNDGANWTTIDRTDNKLYGFTVDKMDRTARYVRVQLVNAVLANNPSNWYTPGLWHVRILG